MINKTSLIQGLFKDKNKDYTYAIIFFLVFSFFMIFAIRPSLDTAFSLRKKLNELKTIDKEYEKEILKIIDLQKKIESVRDDLPILTEAVPNSVRVNKIINDLKKSVDKNNLTINNMSIGSVSLKENLNQKKTSSVEVNLDLKGTFKDGLSFIKDINNQRRLKVIKSFSVERENVVSSDSSKLLFHFSLENYYL